MFVIAINNAIKGAVNFLVNLFDFRGTEGDDTRVTEGGDVRILETDET